VQANETFFLFGDSSNVDNFGLFSSGIENAMTFSKINKSEAIEAKVASIQKSETFVMSSFVEFNEIVTIVAIEHNYTLKVGGTRLL
jgi:hypothetical protein